MKYIKYIAMGLTLMGSASLSSCSSDYLETSSSVALSDKKAQSTVENLYLSLVGIHKEMVTDAFGAQGYGGESGFMVARDAAADDLYWENLSSSWHRIDFLGWSALVDETSYYNSLFWKHYYQWIMNANKILEGLEVVSYDPVGEGDLYNQIKGEALAIRAWAHFNITQYYGERYSATGDNSATLGTVYRTTSSTEPQARETTERTFELINADLTEAYSLLSKVDFNSLSIPAVSHYTPNVVRGIQARVALIMHKYADAAAYAEEAISLSEADGLALMQSEEELYCGFADITTDTDEAMYAATTADDQGVAFYSFYAFLSWNFSSSAIRGGVRGINKETYETMSTTDLRRAWWDPTGSDEDLPSIFTPMEYQNRKYKARATGNSVGDVPFMRLAEMYLICAEGYARDGQDTKAQAVFTDFQVTRDPSYAALGNSGDDLIEEIMNSRRIELWGEGFRWFDLKRLSLPLHRGSNYDTTYCTFIDKDVDADGWVWKIPDDETNYNPLCEQNEY